MIDQAIVVLYLFITLLVGLYVGRNTKTLEDFAIGSRNFSTIALVTTVFATIVDAGMTTGLASQTYSVGPIFLLAFLGIIFSNFNISFLIAPKMKPFLGLLSSGDIFEQLYGKRAKTLMGCSTVIESTLTTAIQIFAISQIAQFFFGLPPIISSILVSTIIIIYTFRGGIKSVTATDVFQFGIMIVAIPMMCGFALIEIGGFNKISEVLQSNPLYFADTDQASNLQYLAIFISFSLPCLYPLCIQRMLMAKSTKQISATFLTNGLLSLPFYVSVGLIGITAYIAIPGTDPGIVFPALINKILPVGAKGLVLAGLIAIFMSTVDSILNIGSIAIIHDIVGSLAKDKLSPDRELRLLKIASVTIAISAVAICHLFSSIVDIVFFLMVIGNSIFFPGFFWGIMGVRVSKTGFWSGVAVGGLNVIFCTVLLDLFPLYTMLISIVINSSFILVFHFLEKPEKKLTIFAAWHPKQNAGNLRVVKSFFSDLIKSQDYCTVFFVCAIAISFFPFFFPAIQGLGAIDKPVLILNSLIATLSLCMIFREIWWDKIEKIFPYIWLLILTLALPAQTIFMLIQSKFSLVWFLDGLILFPLLFLLTSRNAAFLTFAFGLIIAFFTQSFGAEVNNVDVVTSFGYWALVIHMTVLAICLAVFRMRDQETFMVTSSTLAHEASRSFLAFENAACYLNSYLPNIIEAYKNNTSDGISQKALDELLTLPNQLEQAARRSRYIIEKLSFHSLASKAHFEEVNLLDCVINALSDPSLKTKLSEVASITESNDIIIKGDQDQITQVFINLFENAFHAIANKENRSITVKLKNDVISVRDNGSGVRKHDLMNIFDENFSTKSRKGQGLAFCKRVMKNHGGIITCTSILGEFTEFTLRFPLYKGKQNHV